MGLIAAYHQINELRKRVWLPSSSLAIFSIPSPFPSYTSVPFAPPKPRSSSKRTPVQNLRRWGCWPLLNPNVAPRYLLRLGVCAMAARTSLSTVFWSAALDSGNAFFSAFSPEALKNSASVPLREEFLSLEK